MTKLNSGATLPTLPGLLADPKRILKEDDRVDPRILQVLEPFGLDGLPAEPPLDGSAPIEELRSFCSDVEGGFEGFFEAVLSNTQPIDGIERSTEIIKGKGGHEIKLFIHRPVGVSETMPCVYHIHGGGMVMLRVERHSAHLREQGRIFFTSST